MFYTYILFSEKAKKYYVGSCQDITIRLSRHNTGATPSTKHGRPWKLAYFETFETKTEALTREKQIKSMKSKIYILKLIGSSID